MTLETLDGRMIVIGGASRSGKTAYTVQQISKAARVIVWDVEDQFSKLPGFKRITTQPELLKAVMKPGRAKLAFVASGDIKKNFDFWAAAVFFWGKHFGGCVAVAEELADVTNSAKAPGHWGILLRRGLKRGITIYAISQRWAEADKTAFGNASEFVCFRMSSALDMEYVSKRTRIGMGGLESLKPLEFIRFDAATGATSRAKLTFRKK